MHDALVHGALSTPALPAAPRLSSTDEKHTVSLVAPGLSPSDVIIEAHPDGRLTIRGENKRKRDWSIAMPRDADAEEASAEVADGLITVSMKRTKATTVEIGIGTEASPGEQADDDSYTLRLVAAGFAAADLALSVEGGVLEVKGQSARTGARLEKHVRLPRDADATSAHASHVDGILTVSVPTKAAAEPRRIPINAASDDKEMKEGAARPEAAAAEKATEAEEMEEEAVMV